MVFPATMMGEQDASWVLREAWREVQPRLRHAMTECCAEVRPVAGYHFGWCDESGRPVTSNGGKAVRPALALLSAKVAGAEPEAAVDGAVAVELVHNFSLVHDDVMDGDAQRRHRPTVWSVFGVPVAILVGNAMLTAAQQVVLASKHPASGQALTELNGAVQRMLQGQMLDVEFESRPVVDLAECLTMVAGKTGALIECACVLGGLYAGAARDVLGGLREFGRHLGLAFQCVDDLLGIWGDPVRTGKPVWSDLRTRKKSLPVVSALTSGGRAGAELAALYAGTEPLTDEQLARAAHLVAEAGGRAWTQATARQELDAALSCLRAMNAPADTENSLVAVARLIADRQT